MSCEHSLLLQPTISFPNSRIRDFYTPFPKSKPLHDKTGLRLQMAFRGTSSKLIEYVGKVSLEHITDQNYLRNVLYVPFARRWRKMPIYLQPIQMSSETDASTESNHKEGRDQVRKHSHLRTNDEQMTHLHCLTDAPSPTSLTMIPLRKKELSPFASSVTITRESLRLIFVKTGVAK
jgi:hypothetical protein